MAVAVAEASAVAGALDGVGVAEELDVEGRFWVKDSPMMVTV